MGEIVLDCNPGGYQTLVKYANPRIYIGPQTVEVVINLGRSYNTSLSVTKPDVRIEFQQRACGDKKVSEWLSYIVDGNANARFAIPSEFLTEIEDFPRGFYDGKVYIGECHISDVELVKAPGYYVKSARTVDSCFETEWVEPGCQEDNSLDCICNCNGNISENCSCIYKVKDNCPTCYNEVYVTQIELLDGYAPPDECETPVE